MLLGEGLKPAESPFSTQYEEGKSLLISLLRKGEKFAWGIKRPDSIRNCPAISDGSGALRLKPGLETHATGFGAVVLFIERNP
jgi:hypothetical protein